MNELLLGMLLSLLWPWPLMPVMPLLYLASVLHKLIG
jgi:hypothetical protein